jgi:hypothetical protein
MQRQFSEAALRFPPGHSFIPGGGIQALYQSPDFRPPEDATVVLRMRVSEGLPAGALISCFSNWTGWTRDGLHVSVESLLAFPTARQSPFREGIAPLAESVAELGCSLSGRLH